MRKCWMFLTLFFMLQSAMAQDSLVLFSNAQGAYTLRQFSPDIFKITYTPQRYKTTENISDAVILKPVAVNKKLATTSGENITLKNLNILSAYRDSMHGGFNIALAEDEEITGGGERAINLNRRGYRFNLYNNPWYGYGEGADNLNYSVPFFMSNKGYGLLFDNASKGFADIGKTEKNVFKTGFVSGEINVYVIFGRDYQEILSKYHQLTGTQPLPPKWALGNFMSRFGYTSTAQVESIYGSMVKHNIPVDAVIFDLFWFGDSIKQTMGNLEWVNKKKWPDPPKMLRQFRQAGVNPILITEPFVLQTSLKYKAALPYLAKTKAGQPYILKDFYFGKGGLIDIFRNDAQNWFWSQHTPQIEKGVEAWWGDLGEPEKHPADLYHNLKDLGFSRPFAADEVHNIYGHTWTKMLYQKYAKHYPEKRLFSLNRSGFAGSQRFGIFPWSGDVSRSWEGYRAQLPVMLGMAMSGVPYIHADAGGFAGGSGDKQLYTRWLQFAAFTPILRPHGTALYEVDKQAYSFPSEPALFDDPYRSIVRHFINLRYSLTPYNYTLAYKQARFGQPLVAPLSYYYPQDKEAAKVQDQFFWGADIMVAPILYKDTMQRSVYFPEGNWFSLPATMISELSKTDPTPKTFTVNVTLDQMPVFVKGGSFIPMVSRKTYKNIGDTKTDTLVIHHFLDKGYSFGDVYDDDGESKSAIEKRNFDLIRFESYMQGEKKYITIKNIVNGSFAQEPEKRFIMLILHNVSPYVAVQVNKKLFTLKTLDDNTAMITFTYTGDPVVLQLK